MRYSHLNLPLTKEFYKWIDRDTFKKHKDDDTWFGGMIATCWSFGNNKDKGYLFGKDIEEDKRLLHEIVVNKCEKSLETFNKKFELNIMMNIGMFDENMTQRRTRIAREIININKSRVGGLQQLQLQRLQRLQISNKSYQEITIDTPIKETIIYLDTPYADTAKYAKGISHKEFYKWVDTLTDRGYKVYVSSYKSDLECVLEIKHTCSLSATSTNEVTEKLFTNISNPNKKIFKELVQGSLF